MPETSWASCVGVSAQVGLHQGVGWRREMMRVPSYWSVLVAALLLTTGGNAGAHEFRATVKGQVLGSRKAALPGATVTSTNADTNEVATATTNAEGNYTVPFIRPGLYTLAVEMPGF